MNPHPTPPRHLWSVFVASLLLAASPAAAASLQGVPNQNAFSDRSLEQPVLQPSTGWISQVEPRLGVPTFYWAERSHAGRKTLRELGLTPVQAARRYLFENAAMYRQSSAALAESPVQRVHDIGRGAIIVSFRKDVDGVRVFRDELKVIMDRDLELVALSGYLPPHARAELRGQARSFKLGHATALVTALFDLTGVALEPDVLLATGKVVEDYHPFLLTDDLKKTGGLRFGEPARARKVLFTLPEGLEPGYYVELDVGAEDSTDSLAYGYVVSAVDGRVLFRKNLTAQEAFTYRVWADAHGVPFDGPHGTAFTPHPAGIPNGLEAQPVAQQTVTLEHGPISTMDPWLPAGATETRGNNVDAYADLASPDGFGTGDLRAQVTSANTFDFLYEMSVGPSANNTQIQAAITQLFFNNNFFHDWYYDAGFDEASGNAQVNNFGRGGIGNDVLRVEAQDYSGTSNANMATPADGARPRMQMYLFSSANSQSLTLTKADGTTQAFNNNEATFGPTIFDITAPYVLVDDGAGAANTDGCEPFVNAAQVAGNIALIDRGTCTFAAKILNAQTAGAIGVIIANNQGGGAPVLFGTEPAITIPSLSVSRNGGTTLKMHVGTGTLRMFRDNMNDRDGTLDNAIVAHEWGHYISNRLIGDASGLDNLQGVGMGEGWGDFHGLLMMAREEDKLVAGNANWAGVYADASWATTGSNVLYFGIRRVPYSTDFTKNGLTFKHIQDGVPLPANVPTAFGASGNNNSEVHNAGEVWATMLWECYAALLNDSERLTFQQAQQRMREYLVAGYKGTPNSPTFLEARDALLAAAYANDTEDFVLFSDAFARRGAGQKAVAPDRASQNNSPVVEDYSTGNQLHLVGATLDDAVVSCDQDGELDSGETGRLTVTLRNTGAAPLSQTTAQVSTQTQGITLMNGGSISFPTSQPFGTTRGTVEVKMEGIQSVADIRFQVTFTDPELGQGNVPAPETLAFRGNAEELAFMSMTDDVEATTTTWTVNYDRGLDGTKIWRREALSPLQHVWYTPNPDSPADVFLESPPLQVDPAGELILTFKHRYDLEADYDGGVIELRVGNGVYEDIGKLASPGYTGTLIEERSPNPLAGREAFTGRSAGFPEWQTVTINLGTAYAGQTVYVRFRVGTDTAAGAVGWQIDDIHFDGLTGAPFPSVVAQRKVCGNGSPVPNVVSSITVDEGQIVTLEGSGSDPDGDVLTGQWTQQQGPTVDLAPSGELNATFTAPQVDGDTRLLFEFTVSDGKERSDAAYQEVIVRDFNAAPIAKIAAPVEARAGERVVLNGTESSDPEGATLAWRWSQTGGPAVTLEGASGAAPAFVMPELKSGEKLTFTLVVNDGRQDSAPATAEIAPEGALGAGCGCSSGTSAGLAPLWGLLLGVLVLQRRRASRA